MSKGVALVTLPPGDGEHHAPYLAVNVHQRSP